MYSSSQLAKKYLRYYYHASNGKGHGIHSPFVYDFIINVLNDKSHFECFDKIESLRRQLLCNTSFIDVEDFGAGSAMIKTKKRAINKIAASSLKHSKFARLLFRIVNYYKPHHILELGTSFGTSTAYMASGNPDAKLYTLEGAAAIAAIAMDNFKKLGTQNIHLRQGPFMQTLQPLLSELQKIDLAFIDGNHRKEPTLEYFTQILNCSVPSTMIILDDIHWSAEMEEAWTEIQQHAAVTLTIDLFFMGMVFINPDFRIKQHFSIRF